MVIRSTLKEDFTSSSGLPTTLKDLHVPAHMSTDQIEEAPDDISSCYSGLVPSLSAMNIKSKPLGFLDLPTEIRIQIYKYFFSGLRIYLKGCHYDDDQTAPLCHTPVNFFLLSRQIYNESLPIFLQKKPFRIPATSMRLRGL